MYILLHFTHAHTDIAKERDKQQSNVYCLPVKLETSRIHIRRQKEAKKSNVYICISKTEKPTEKMMKAMKTNVKCKQIRKKTTSPNSLHMKHNIKFSEWNE